MVSTPPHIIVIIMVSTLRKGYEIESIRVSEYAAVSGKHLRSGSYALKRGLRSHAGFL